LFTSILNSKRCLVLERKKRNHLEVIYDILCVVRDHGRQIRITPLIRYSGLSPQRFDSYFGRLVEKGFLVEKSDSGEGRLIVLTEKGAGYIREYMAVLRFIREFELDQI
jgi:predicted transcriptional regulator